MLQSAALQRFVDDEVARMPALIEQVRRQTIDALRQPTSQASNAPASAAERMQRFDIAKALELHARRFAETFVDRVARRLADSSERLAADAPAAASSRGLALIDDAAHEADLEIGRCAALIGSAADWELRELQTFTSALCGLPFVSVGANPLRPEVFAQALWQASDAVPGARGNPLLLRTASPLLAEALRRALAAACTRLEAEGVQPSLYRTAVPAQGERPSVLAELLDGAPAQESGDDGAASAELLRSLFEVVDQSRQMHPALRALTGLLHGVARGLVRRDASLLDDARHPLWQWLDRFAYQTATHPNPADPQLLAWAGHAAELVARVQAAPLPDAELLHAGIEQLDAYAAAQFNAQLGQAMADIERLQGNNPGLPAVDLESMETVPAGLLADAPAAGGGAAAAWLDQQAPGAWYRIFLRGGWTVVRLLWRSDAGTRWLFASPHPQQRHDAFDRGALLRLRGESLLRPLVERAIVVRAAESVRRRLTDPRTRG